MRKALALGFIGALLASPVLAGDGCGWGASKTAADGSKQTVMTDSATQAPKPASGG
jgi:hypothetical protein